jgi:hypothetical protein
MHIFKTVPNDMTLPRWREENSPLGNDWVVSQEKFVLARSPEERHISTSLIERQNLTMRMSMRRP